MDIFSVLNLIGGLSLFLFGMNLMGQALERRVGSGLRTLLGKLTGSKWAGLLTGLGITSIIQSSSATTVMVVGFVNSGLMSLSQSINVIMGANIGTTVTAWILSLAGIDSENVFVRLLNPTSFTPILALIGIILYMFCKNDKKKDSGVILLGFATLMFGMETMSNSVAGLSEVPEFRQLFITFTNPILGVLAGAILTGIIQSSSASVGILQALASTGQVSYGAAIPIIMGQNIGTCVTALLSSVGTNKNAKRAAMVHLSFNVLGTAVWLTVFCIVKAVFSPMILTDSASLVGIAICHSAFNILCTILMLPLGGFLEKLVCVLVPDDKRESKAIELDERLLVTPSIALKRCESVMHDMAAYTKESLDKSLMCLRSYSGELAEQVRFCEQKTDHYEDIMGKYLVKLSACEISDKDSVTVTQYLKLIGDFERIADHSSSIVDSAEEIKRKDTTFAHSTEEELTKMCQAVSEILKVTTDAFDNNDVHAALGVKNLKYAIDGMKEDLRYHHIQRLRNGESSIETGFVLSDILTNLKRIADHCLNIADCVISGNEDADTKKAISEAEDNSGEYEKMVLNYQN